VEDGRVERSGRPLRPQLLEAGGRAGDEIPFERVARFVLAPAALERLDRMPDLVAIAGHPNREQRIERLHDGHEIARAELPVDEARQRRTRALRARAGADVILVEQDREEPRAVAA